MQFERLRLALDIFGRLENVAEFERIELKNLGHLKACFSDVGIECEFFFRSRVQANFQRISDRYPSSSRNQTMKRIKK